LSTKIHVLVDALGNPFNLMLTPGQAHDLTAAEPLLETADPRALIGDKAYDSDPLIGMLERRAITPVIPPRENRKVTAILRSIASATSLSVSGTKSSITVVSLRAMTSSLEISWPRCTWSRLSSCSTEDTP
jgi:transposase